MQALGLSWRGDASPAFQEIHIVRDAPIHRGAKLLLDAWSACEAKGRFVVGRDVPSREIARILSGLALYEPVGADFKVRLAGHALRRRFGRDVTGMTLSALLGDAQFAEHGAQIRALLETGKPLVIETRLSENDRIRHSFETVALRVFAPDGETPWVMSGIFFFDWRL